MPLAKITNVTHTPIMKTQIRPPMQNISVKLNEEQRAWLQERANTARCPMSEVIRALVERARKGARK